MTAVNTVDEAVELLTGIPAGERDLRVTTRPRRSTAGWRPPGRRLIRKGKKTTKTTNKDSETACIADIKKRNPMKSRRKNPRISTQQEVEVYLYNRSKDSQLTGRMAALLFDLSKQGAGLKFPQALIDGVHLFYAALESDTIVIIIVFQPTDDEPEKSTTLMARPVWFDRDMEDSALPFRMGVQFVDQTPP